MKTVAMVLTGARVLNVYTGEFEQTNLWLDQGKVVSRLPHPDLTARETVDLTGQYVVPGFIDAHVHVEVRWWPLVKSVISSYNMGSRPSWRTRMSLPT